MINDAEIGVAIPFLILYIFGMIYMMIALSIICDEYFVPALEVMTDIIGISPDVAGATLMAAGGSAPELFTSMIGTFQESDIGFGTIVGSAVFNVLFVIGCCAIFSKEVLTLTWWPIFRDFTYYIISLTMLGIFFGVLSGQQIELWESLVLIGMYFIYVLLMAYNVQLRDMLLKCVGKYIHFEMHVEPCSKVTQAISKHPSTFRSGILRILIKGKSIWKTVPYRIVTDIEGDLNETFKKLDINGNGVITMSELQELKKADGDWGDLTKVFEFMDTNHDGEITFQEFRKMYMKSEHRIDDEMKFMFDHFDHDNTGTLSSEEMRTMLQYAGHESFYGASFDHRSSVGSLGGSDMPTNNDLSLGAPLLSNPGTYNEDVQIAIEQIAGTGADQISFDQFKVWYKQQLFYEKKLEEAEEAADHHATTLKELLHWPAEEGCLGKFWYILVLPLMVIMFITIPDVT